MKYLPAIKYKAILFVFFCWLADGLSAQTLADSLTEADIKKHMSFLSSNKLNGRVNFSKEQLKAARYLSSEFTACGLKPYPSYPNFYQPFYSRKDDLLPPFTITDTLLPTTLYNVIGILPGKSKPEESIIISAHYDHVDADVLGFGGSVFNGANDNASGTTAVLLLARYFSLRNDNERTIVFCLFAGEELGLYGSNAFVRQVSASDIKAMINIEMIGRHDAAGSHAFFITGSSRSDLEEVLKKNIAGVPVTIVEERDEKAMLFMRSDNFPFAAKGIVAHSIMCSDDSDACYHKPCDDLRRIDIPNMAVVIRAIAVGCSTLISGEDTPVRKR